MSRSGGGLRAGIPPQALPLAWRQLLDDAALDRMQGYLMRIFVDPPYDRDSVDQTVRHALNILHAAGIFLNVGVALPMDTRWLWLKQATETRALAAFRRAGMRAVAG